MIDPKELEGLKQKYGPYAIQTCPLCGQSMTFRTLFPNDEPAFVCLRSEAKKYSKEWWDHLERSKDVSAPARDPLVLKLIDAYERMIDGQNTV